MSDINKGRFSNINPLAVIFSLLGILLIGAIAMQLEQREIKVETGLKGEARTNPLYAHRLFLKRMGLSAEKKNDVNAFKQQPSEQSVVFLYTPYSKPSEEQTTRLLDWVKAGGHLITTTGSSEENNPLLNELGISINNQIYLDDDEANNPEIESEDEGIIQQASWNITLPNHDKALKIQPDFFRPLSSEYDDEFVELNDEVFLINATLDMGLVTVVSEMDFLEKEGLGDLDHAEFFYNLINYHHEYPETIWLISNGSATSLLTLAWQNARLLMITLVVFLITLFFFLKQRFGPILPVPSLDRRRIMEHVRASGHHLWKHKQADLIDSTRQDLQQTLTKLVPGWSQWEQHEKIQYLSEKASMDEKAVENLLYSTETYHQDEFIRVIKQLQALKKKLI
jgi:hypothetical protein